MSKSMGNGWLIWLASLVSTGAVLAQAPIYRCGNEYTNSKPEGRDCKLLSGGNLTVIESTPVPKPTAAPVAGAPASQTRKSATPQDRRDADARLILQAELDKARARQRALLTEFNNGQPDKIGAETRNHQKYLDRVESLRASLARVAGDIAGIERELDRLPAPGSGAR